jgi:hypothetical protein
MKSRMKALSNYFYRVSSARNLVISLIVFVAFSILVLPEQSTDSATYASNVGSPDLSFFYSPEDLYRMAEAYGVEGREEYIKARFTFDLIWPVVYTAFLTMFISWLFGRSIPTYSGFRTVNLIPIFGMLFDYLENISTSIVMWRFPEKMIAIAVIAPVFTLLKWILISIAFLLLVVGGISVLLRRMMR